MRCPTCGSRVPDNARYCSNCATAMERCHDDERDPADFGCRHAENQGPDQTPPSRTYRRPAQSSGAGKLFGFVFTVIFIIIFLFAASMIINTGRRINRGFENFDNMFVMAEEQIVELEPELHLEETPRKGK